MIMYCECKHDEQDKLHGARKRVFNKTQRKFGEKTFFYRCTVCGAEKVGRPVH